MATNHMHKFWMNRVCYCRVVRTTRKMEVTVTSVLRCALSAQLSENNTDPMGRKRPTKQGGSDKATQSKESQWAQPAPGRQRRNSLSRAKQSGCKPADTRWRNRTWTEDEEARLAVLLLTHGTQWDRVASGLEGRTPNTVRCKVYNDLRAVRESYRRRWQEYMRLLFRIAFRMEEHGLRLDQLTARDFYAALSPIDHPRLYAAHTQARLPPPSLPADSSEEPWAPEDHGQAPEQALHARDVWDWVPPGYGYTPLLLEEWDAQDWF